MCVIKRTICIHTHSPGRYMFPAYLGEDSKKLIIADRTEAQGGKDLYLLHTF